MSDMTKGVISSIFKIFTINNFIKIGTSFSNIERVKHAITTASIYHFTHFRLFSVYIVNSKFLFSYCVIMANNYYMFIEKNALMGENTFQFLILKLLGVKL